MIVAQRLLTLWEKCHRTGHPVEGGDGPKKLRPTRTRKLSSHLENRRHGLRGNAFLSMLDQPFGLKEPIRNLESYSAALRKEY